MTAGPDAAVAEAIAGFLRRIGEVRAEAVQDTALAAAALAVADDVAVAFGVADEPEVAGFAAFAEARSRLPEATLFREGGERVDRFWAAAVNAMAMTAAEFDEGSRNTPCHAGLYTIPALLAEGEASGATMGEALRAEVLAYEVTVRLADMWKAASGAYPNHYTHAKSGTVGAGVARGLVMGLDWRGLSEVVGVASTLTAAGPRSHLLGGALVRNAWPAASAWAGMMAVGWAGWGAKALPTSNPDVFAGVLGFEPAVDVLAREVGSRWEVENGYHRLHATHLFLSALVECLLQIRPQVLAGPGPDAIEAIEIEIHADAAALTETDPATSLAARFSLPHVAAAVLSLGHAEPAAFAASTLRDPALSVLRGKVEVRAVQPGRFAGAKWPAAVQVRAGGRTFSAECAEALGGHGQPVPDDMVFEKIDRLTAPHWPGFGMLARRLVALETDVLQMPVSAFLAEARTAGTQR